MDFKMYCFMCFILLVSCNTLFSIATEEAITSQSTESTSFISLNVNGSHVSVTQNTYSSKSTKNDSTIMTKTTENIGGTTQTQSKPPITQTQSKPPITHDGCLINLKDGKDLLLWSIISLLCLICVLLLIIIMCMACKCCRGTRNNEVVMLKSSTSVRRNSVNGGPSETDVLLKACSSVKVEMETIPAESEKPEEVGGADAEEVENQDTTEENKNAANDTSETAPTQEADQSAQTDLKTETLENAE